LTSAFETIGRDPLILVLGNGMDRFAQLAYYPQPHNTYVYVLLDYGLPGLGLLISAIAGLLVYGWRDLRTGAMQDHHMLAAAWIAALTLMVFIGAAESNLYGVEGRMITLSFLACYLALRSEVVWRNAPREEP
jgi:O-antigen ligase